MVLRNILPIVFRNDDSLHAGLTGAVGLFKYAADGLYLPPHGNFARNGHILSDRRLRNRRDEGRRNRAACRRAVDVSAADKVDIDVVIGQFLARHAAHHGSGVEHGILGHRTGRIVEAVIALAGLAGGKGYGFDFNRRA